MVRICLLFVLLLLAGCDTHDPVKSLQDNPKLVTVQHDGHKFIRMLSASGGVIHHPSCPCLAKP